MPKTLMKFRGFTLLELMMVLALMGLAVGFFVLQADQALRNAIRQQPNDLLFDAIAFARLEAVTRKQDCFLHYDPSMAAFIVSSPQTILASFALPDEQRPQVRSFRFRAIEPIEAARSLRPGDPIVLADEDLEFLRFEPTGAASFAVAEWEFADAIHGPERTAIDPFSNGPMEVALP
jgi:prepilin-type N-terminal cleavage/methylation domain-containing protein